MNEPRGRHLCRNSISAPCDRRREAVDHDVGERMAMSPLDQAVYAHLGYEPDLYVHLRGASRYSLTAAPGS